MQGFPESALLKHFEYGTGQLTEFHHYLQYSELKFSLPTCFENRIEIPRIAIAHIDVLFSCFLLHCTLLSALMHLLRCCLAFLYAMMRSVFEESIASWIWKRFKVVIASYTLSWRGHLLLLQRIKAFFTFQSLLLLLQPKSVGVIFQLWTLLRCVLSTGSTAEICRCEILHSSVLWFHFDLYSLHSINPLQVEFAYHWHASFRMHLYWLCWL